MDFRRLNKVFSFTAILIWGLGVHAMESEKDVDTVDETVNVSVVSVADEQAETQGDPAVDQDDCD